MAFDISLRDPGTGFDFGLSDAVSDGNANAGNASGTGAAYSLTTEKISQSAGLASGAAAANTTKAAISARPNVATGTGTANILTAEKISQSAGNSAGTGAAYNTTAETVSSFNANAGLATGTGSANNASVSIRTGGLGNPYPWLNHVTIAAPRNGTNSHTVDPKGVAVHASSPAGVTSATSTATTASFTPPANSVLLAVCAEGNPTGAATVNGWVSDSLGGSWNNLVSAGVANKGWTMAAALDVGASPSAMTVSFNGWNATDSIGNPGTAITVYVLTGSQSASTIKGTDVVSTTSISTSLTAANGSLVVFAQADVDVQTTYTAVAGCQIDAQLNDTTNGASYFIGRSTSVVGAGSFNAGATGSAVTPQLLVVEVLPKAAVVAGTNFAPTAGNFLVAACAGAITFTTPTGWTLNGNCAASANGAIYVFMRDAAGGDTFTTTANGSNYPAVFDLYEFAAESAFYDAEQISAGAYNNTGAPALASMTDKLILSFAEQCAPPTLTTVSWVQSEYTELVDTWTDSTGTDGYTYAAAYAEHHTGAAEPQNTFSWSGNSAERVTVALDVQVTVAGNIGNGSGSANDITAKIDSRPITATGGSSSVELMSDTFTSSSFPDTFTGTDGAAWSTTGQWDTASSGTATIQGNRGRLVVGSEYTFGEVKAAAAGSIDAADFDYTIELRPSEWGQAENRLEIEFRHDIPDPYRQQVVIDASNWDGVETITPGRVQLRRNAWGVVTVLDATQINIGTTPTVISVRIYANGSSIKVKAWRDGESEPNAWGIEVTDSTYATQTGFGFRVWSGAGAATWEVDSPGWDSSKWQTGLGAGTRDILSNQGRITGSTGYLTQQVKPSLLTGWDGSFDLTFDYICDTNPTSDASQFHIHIYGTEGGNDYYALSFQFNGDATIHKNYNWGWTYEQVSMGGRSSGDVIHNHVIRNATTGQLDWYIWFNSGSEPGTPSVSYPDTDVAVNDYMSFGLYAVTSTRVALFDNVVISSFVLGGGSAYDATADTTAAGTNANAGVATGSGSAFNTVLPVVIATVVGTPTWVGYTISPTVTFTPVANKTYLGILARSCAANQDATTGEFSAGGSNFASGPTQISLNNTSTHSWYHSLQIWKMQAGASPSGTTTFRCPYVGDAAYSLAVLELTYDDYANLVVQEKKVDTDNPTNITLTSAPATDSLILTTYVFDNDVNNLASGGEGTELVDIATADPTMAIYARSGTTSTSIASASADVPPLVVVTALELKYLTVGTNANPTLATGTGSAYSLTAEVVGQSVSLASGTGSALSVAALLSARGIAGIPSATGTAYGVSVRTSPLVGLATGSGVALSTIEFVDQRIGLASATGSAYNPSAITGVYAFAGLATATGLAQNSNTSVIQSVSLATGTGSANTLISEAIGQSAGLATATGTAYDLATSTPASPATLAEYQEIPWNASGARSFPSISWSTGDLITIIYSNDWGGNVPSTPTVTGLTFAPVTGFPVGLTNSVCRIMVWAATAAGNGSGAISISGGSSDWGGSLWRWQNHSGIGRSVSSAPVVPLASISLQTDAGSAVIGEKADYNGVAATYTGTPTVNVEREDQKFTFAHVWVADWLNQAAGTRAYGVTSLPGGTNDTLGFVEILPLPGSGNSSNANTGIATSTGVANSFTSEAIGQSAGLASGTSSAFSASQNILQTVISTNGTGSALNATGEGVESGTEANAQLATGTSTANNTALGFTLGLATGTDIRSLTDTGKTHNAIAFTPEIDISPDGKYFYNIDNGAADRIYRHVLDTNWDISTINDSNDTYWGYGSVAPVIHGLAFKPDGTRCWIGSTDEYKIYELDLSTPWDITTAVYNSVNITVHSFLNATGLYISPDGTHLFARASYIDRYDLSTPYSLASASWVHTSTHNYSVSRSFWFSNDGDIIYYAEESIFDIFLSSRKLTTPWVLNSGVQNAVSFQITADGTNSVMVPSPDNTRLYTQNTYTTGVKQWSLATAAVYAPDPKIAQLINISAGTAIAYNATGESVEGGTNADAGVATATGTSNNAALGFTLGVAYGVDIMSLKDTGKSYTTPDNSVGIWISPDGRYIYDVLDNTTSRIYRYTLDTPWDISTINGANNIYWNYSAVDTEVRGIAFKSDGMRCWIIGNTANRIFELDLSTPWDISTAVYNSVSLDISAEEPTPWGLHISPDGTHIIARDSRWDRYDLSIPYSLASASYVHTSGLAVDIYGFTMSRDGTRIYHDSSASVNNFIAFRTLTTPWVFNSGMSAMTRVLISSTNEYQSFIAVDTNERYIYQTRWVGADELKQWALYSALANNASQKVSASVGLASGTGSSYNAIGQSASATYANAELITATGTAYSSAAKINQPVGLASGTGSALNITALLSGRGITGLSTGTGLANNTTALLSARGLLTSASGIGLANNTTASLTAQGICQLAAGTGLANSLTAEAIGQSAGLATGTGIAYLVAQNINQTVGFATGTGQALNATAQTASATNANAELATGSGADNDAKSNIGVNANLATGTGLAYQTSTRINPSSGNTNGVGLGYNLSEIIGQPSGLSSGVGAANAPPVSIRASVALAAGTGLGYNPSTSLVAAPAAGLATGTGLANSLTAESVGQTAQLAVGSGTANNAKANVGATISVATGTGSTQKPGLSFNLGTGTGTGSASNASDLVLQSVGISTATGIAYNISYIAASRGIAGVAAGTGSASELTSEAIVQPVGIATGTGSAFAATNIKLANANIQLASGSGTAYPLVGEAIGQSAQVATGTGSAQNAIANPGGTCSVATGTGAGYKLILGVTAGLASGVGSARTPSPGGVSQISAVATGIWGGMNELGIRNAVHWDEDDASSATITSAAINTTAGALMVVYATIDQHIGAPNVMTSASVSDSGGETWNTILSDNFGVENQAALVIAWAVATSTVSRTFSINTVRSTGQPLITAAWAQVITNQITTGTPLLVGTASSSTTQNITPSITTTAPRSYVIGIAGDAVSGGSGDPTTTDVLVADHAHSSVVHFDAIAARKASFTENSGTSVGINFIAETASPQWRYALTEILAKQFVKANVNHMVPTGAASGTGSANDIKVSIGAKTTTNNGSGLANKPGIAATLNSTNGSGSAVGNAISIKVAAQLTTGSGTAYTLTAEAVGQSAQLANGTGTAYNSRTNIGVNTNIATGTGIASKPGIGSTTNSSSGTGSATGGTINLGATIVSATGTGTAYNATASTASAGIGNAGVATGTATVNNIAVRVGVNTGSTSGAGSASGTNINLSVNLNTATGTGNTNNSANNIIQSVNLATGNGLAYNTIGGASSIGNAQLASGTGLAYSLTSEKINQTANTATGIGSANNTLLSIRSSVQVATGTGLARAATANAGESAGTSTGTGSGGAPGQNILQPVIVSTGIGSAKPATGNVGSGATAEVATGTGSAYPATTITVPIVIAVINTSFGALVALASANVNNFAAINTSFGSLSSTVNAEVDITATAIGSWGQLNSDVHADRTMVASINTNLGGWSATADATTAIYVYGVINTSFGGLTATAAANLAFNASIDVVMTSMSGIAIILTYTDATDTTPLMLVDVEILDKTNDLSLAGTQKEKTNGPMTLTGLQKLDDEKNIIVGSFEKIY